MAARDQRRGPGLRWARSATALVSMFGWTGILALRMLVTVGPSDPCCTVVAATVLFCLTQRMSKMQAS